jgi:hypothetical protein
VHLLVVLERGEEATRVSAEAGEALAQPPQRPSSGSTNAALSTTPKAVVAQAPIARIPKRHPSPTKIARPSRSLGRQSAIARHTIAPE